MTKKQKLTAKQRKFVDEYINCGIGMQAAIKAGYSKRSAKQVATNTLKRPYVQEYYQKRLKQLEDESIMSMKEVRQRLTANARGQNYDENVTTVKVPEMMEINGRDRLVYVEHVKVVRSRIKTSDQNKALELLGKTGALFTDNTNATLNIKPVEIIDDIPDAPESKPKGDDS